MSLAHSVNVWAHLERGAGQWPRCGQGLKRGADRQGVGSELGRAVSGAGASRAGASGTRTGAGALATGRGAERRALVLVARLVTAGRLAGGGRFFAGRFLTDFFATTFAVDFTADFTAGLAAALGRCVFFFFFFGAARTLAAEGRTGLERRACFQALRAALARLRARRTSRLASLMRLRARLSSSLASRTLCLATSTRNRARATEAASSALASGVLRSVVAGDCFMMAT